MTIRPERPKDIDAIRRVVTAAFPTAAEARLVDALRGAERLLLSLVADSDDEIVGHVALSPVTVDGVGGGLGLAPIAVLPERQRGGVGSALMRAALAACRDRDAAFVVVLGDPAYYLRFGFAPAAARGLGNEYGAADEFMVVELRRGGIPAAGGLVRYTAEFAAVT